MCFSGSADCCSASLDTLKVVLCHIASNFSLESVYRAEIDWPDAVHDARDNQAGEDGTSCEDVSNEASGSKLARALVAAAWQRLLELKLQHEAAAASAAGASDAADAGLEDAWHQVQATKLLAACDGSCLSAYLARLGGSQYACDYAASHAHYCHQLIEMPTACLSDH